MVQSVEGAAAAASGWKSPSALYSNSVTDDYQNNFSRHKKETKLDFRQMPFDVKIQICKFKLENSNIF